MDSRIQRDRGKKGNAARAFEDYEGLKVMPATFPK